MEKGANLNVIGQYKDASLTKDAQHLLQNLLDQCETLSIDGLLILLATFDQKFYTGHLASITRKLMEITGTDAAYSIVKMGEKLFITARSASDRVSVLPVIQRLGGGGHSKAASAMKKSVTISEVLPVIKELIPSAIKPSITAADIMSSPVRVVSPETSIEVASKMLYRYGHTGFPVVDDEKLIGIISRRDVDKALHHHLGHAPVKGYMSRKPIVINPDESLETIQEFMIEKQIGRLPVIDRGELVGIVSRTDVISVMHGNIPYERISSTKVPLKRQMKDNMEKQLSPEAYELLTFIGKEADSLGMKAYLIGGMVRDLLMSRKNEDMDIVVEGDGITLADHLQQKYGGHVRSHEEFRTATWKYSYAFKVDLTSARTEYYDFPAALPKVELSTIKEDLFRRDFTINAMAICLHRDEFGELIDYFHGFEDLKQRQIRILYNLSFVEDPTRILRAIRFESRFHYAMDQQTEALAVESANNLLSVSKSRIANELSRLFMEENPLFSVKRFVKLGLLPFLIKDTDTETIILQRIKRLYDAVYRIKKSEVQVNNSLWIIYVLFLTTIKNKSWMEVEKYCLTKEDMKLLSNLQLLLKSDPLLDWSYHATKDEWHEVFSEFEVEVLISYFSLYPNVLTQGCDYLIAREKLTSIITGEDLIENGFDPGPHFRKLLLESEKIQLNNPKITSKEIIEHLISRNDI
nr:CBS domain-containing protein [Evansella tamaricis]